MFYHIKYQYKLSLTLINQHCLQIRHKILPLENQISAINDPSEKNDMYRKTKTIQIQKPVKVVNQMNNPVMIPGRFIHHVRITK